MVLTLQGRHDEPCVAGAGDAQLWALGNEQAGWALQRYSVQAVVVDG
jgi:hypothetical protein